MNVNKTNKDIEVLCNLCTIVSDHVSHMMSFAQEYIHECDDTSELIDLIIKRCLDSEKMIVSLMLKKIKNC